MRYALPNVAHLERLHLAFVLIGLSTLPPGVTTPFH